MSEHNTSHGACGKTWRQRGNRTGHCPNCHETFEGVALFDAHRATLETGARVCKEPAAIEFPKSFPLILVNGSWRTSQTMPKSLIK